MAASIVETPLSPGSIISGPSFLARASDGAFWTVGHSSDYSSVSIQRTDGSGLSKIMQTLPSGEQVRELIAGRNGAVWAVTDAGTLPTHLLKLTKDYTVATPLPERPDSLTTDAEGDIWVASREAWNTPARTTLREYDGRTGAPKGTPIVRDGLSLNHVTASSDGSLWMYDGQRLQASRFGADGSYREYWVGVQAVLDVVAGKDGSIWVAGRTDGIHPVLANVSGDGRVTRVGLGVDTLNNYGDLPGAIAPAPDGSVWYIDGQNQRIGRVDPDGSTWAVPMPGPRQWHFGLVSDGSAGAYFTEFNTNAIAHLGTDAPDPGVEVRARSFNANEGVVPAPTTIATFTTPDASAFSFDFVARYQIDGQIPHDGVVLSDGNGGFVVQAGVTGDVQEAGAHFLTVTIIDVKHGFTVGAGSTGFAVATIADPPVSVVGRTFSTYVGAVYFGAIGTVIDPAPIAGPRGSTATTIDWGDGSAPVEGGQLFVSAHGTFDVSGSGGLSHIYSSPGTYTVIVTANHNGQITAATSTAIVSLATVQDLTGRTAGFSAGTTGRAIVATFTSSRNADTSYPGSGVDPSSYVARVDWAGGHVAGEVVEYGSGYAVYANINFATWGQVPITVSVSPASGGLATQAKLDALVTPAPITASLLPIATNVTGLWGGNVASFSSFNPASEPGDYRASVATADGGAWTAQVIADGSGGFLVYASHAFTQSGHLATTVTIDNLGADGAIANGATLKGTSEVAAPRIANLRPGANPVEFVQGTSGGVSLATFVPLGSNAAPGDFVATVDWGDGVPQAATIYQANSVFNVWGLHRYATLEATTPKVTIRDAGGTASETISVPVRVVRPKPYAPRELDAAPVLNTTFKGAWAHFSVDSSIASSASDFVATVAVFGGPPAAYANVVNEGPGRYRVELPYTFDTPGPHSASILIGWKDDLDINRVEVFTQFFDVPASPIWLSNAVFAGQVGAPVGGVVASFVDTKPNDVAKYAATIDWADGTTSDGVVSSYGSQFVVYAKHSYANAGTYANKVTIKNDGAVAGVALGGIEIKAAPGPIGTPGGGEPVGGGSAPAVASSFVQVLANGTAKLLLNYSGAIDATKARDRTRYAITFAGKDGKLGTKDDKAVRVNAVSYNGSTHQVAITPKGTFARSAKFRVAIRGEGSVSALLARR